MKQNIYKSTQVLIVDKLVERFKEVFEDTAKLNLEQLDRLYSENVHFKDSIHDIHGITQLKGYMEKLCADVDICRFEYLAQVIYDGKS